MDHGVLVAEEREVGPAREGHEPGAGDALGHVAAGPVVGRLVAGPVQQQHGHLDRAEQPADVHRAEGPDSLVLLRERGRRHQEHPDPVPHRGVVGLLRRHHLEEEGRVLERRPVLDHRQQALVLLEGRPPRVVLVAEGGRMRPEGDHSRHLVGVGGGHQKGQAAAGVAAEQRRPVRADGRHDRADVVHLVLEHVSALPAV
jgi:hypothetical protein